MPKIEIKKSKLIGQVIDKETTILNLCKEKVVLHLGCADYPFHKESVKHGLLLHDKLSKVSERLFGVDKSPEGIAYLKEKGFEDLYLFDIENLEDFKPLERIEVIVAGEVLEHLSNVGNFFVSIRRLMNEDTLLIVTTPNAHSMKSFLRVITGRELIHPEHLYYFSPTNIEHFCVRYGFKVVEYNYYISESQNIVKKIVFAPIEYLVGKISPHVSDGILLILMKDIINA